MALTLLSCGASGPSGGGTGASRDASGQIIVPSDAGYRIVDFACDSGVSDHDVGAPPDGLVEAGGCFVENPNVTFQTVVLPVLAGCSGELCHAPWSYATTVNVVSHECCDNRKLIEPGSPERSYLLQKIRGIHLCGNSNPMGNVPSNTTNDISDWICLGAPDN
jgi:hypothetical protein